MVTDASDIALIILDEKPLRRAEVASMLREWVSSRGFGIVAFGLDDPFATAGHHKCGMYVLNVGSSFDDTRWSMMIRFLHGLHPDVPIVVMSDTESADHVHAAFGAGACGFLPTSLEPEVAAGAFSFLLAGGTYFPPSALEARCNPEDPPRSEKLSRPVAKSTIKSATEKLQIRPPHGSGVDPTTGIGNAKATEQRIEAADCGAAGPALTERQSEVMKCLRAGQTNKEIARKLDMSEATVKVHVRQVMRKLGASNRTQAALIAASGQPKETSVLDMQRSEPEVFPKTESDPDARRPELFQSKEAIGGHPVLSRVR